MRFTKLLGRALLLKCPICGEGKLFRNLLVMHERCSHCQNQFEREPGFFLGSIYIDYGLTALVPAIAYPVLLFGYKLPETPLLIASLAYVLVFPLWFHRYARSLWAGFDQWRDPQPGEK